MRVGDHVTFRIATNLQVLLWYCFDTNFVLLLYPNGTVVAFEWYCCIAFSSRKLWRIQQS